MKKIKNVLINEIKDWKGYSGIVIGCLLSAVGLANFLIPGNIASGGVAGASMVIHQFIPVSVGYLMLVLNIPLFIISFKELGLLFGFRSLIATVLLSVLIVFLEKLPILTQDVLLASVFGGVILGVGLGIVIRCNATTGGTDLLARLLHKVISFVSIGQWLLVIDFIVLASAAIVFNNIELGLYAAISLYITTIVIDNVIVGIDFTKSAYIISDHSVEIADKILHKLDRGVTGLKGTGMFSGTDKTVLLCVLRKREVPKLRRIVKEIDNNAFIFLSEAREVFGEGFVPHE